MAPTYHTRFNRLRLRPPILQVVFCARCNCPVSVLRTLRRAEYFEMVVLFFIQGAALGMWFVPLGAVLDAHGLNHIKAYAFATAGLAAFVSPLIFGAVADRHASPVKVLRGLALATAAAMILASTAIRLGWSPWIVLALIQVHALCSSPTWSISSTIIFARLADAKKEFGPIRAMVTLGWVAGCLLVSAVNADATTLSGYGSAAAWVLVAAFTFYLPALETPKSVENLKWHERLGLDALQLLKDPKLRVMFLIPALLNIPLAAFYPYAPAHLREFGLQHTAAWMSLGQITEVITMFSLGVLLLRWRLKWIIAMGLAFSVLRYVFSAFGGEAGLIAGVVLHGCSFVPVFITAQIYLDQQVDPAWRARAQALMSLLNGGIGNLVGYLGAGWWFTACTQSGGVTRWPLFWGGLAAAVAVVMVYFMAAYSEKDERQKTDRNLANPEPKPSAKT